jgi:short-subunit dehydrogenase involved in D-alanine esterification of teichoic acids
LTAPEASCCRRPELGAEHGHHQPTVFIAGATSGIGLELARRFATAGSTVIAGGRRIDLLDKIAGEGLVTVPIDVTDQASIERARDTILRTYPHLDTIVTMSGVMILEDVRDPAHFAVAQQTIDINLLGTIRVIDAFTPHLTGRGAGTIITVSSGTGFLPFPPMPTYGASKAGVHAYSEALRAQLDGTGVEVCELVPRPWPTPRRWQGSTPTRWGWPSSAPR